MVVSFYFFRLPLFIVFADVFFSFRVAFFFKVFERFSYLSPFFHFSATILFFSLFFFVLCLPPCRSTTLVGSKNLSIFPKQKSLQNQTSGERFSPVFCLRFSFHFSFIFHVLTFLSLVLNIFVFDAFFKKVFLFLFKFLFFWISICTFFHFLLHFPHCFIQKSSSNTFYVGMLWYAKWVHTCVLVFYSSGLEPIVNMCG